MEFCTRCGDELGAGRFCTNCGLPIESRNPATQDDWREDTADRPIPPPATPPPPPAQPTGRYPLFADQVPAGQPKPHRRPRPPWVIWAFALGLVLALVATPGAYLLLTDDEAGNPGAVAPSSTVAEPTSPTSPSSPSTPRSTPPSPSSSQPPVKPDDVAALATVRVPATAPPNLDVSGNQVRYEGRNMLDGVPETCWRMPGDGTGTEITIRLDSATLISRVGLINGYAKTAIDANGERLDWYLGNRRILAVAWLFDDGSVVNQDLAETRRLQSVDVEPVRTRTVRLRLVRVSQPGASAPRDYTPISDVTIVGTPRSGVRSAR